MSRSAALCLLLGAAVCRCPAQSDTTYTIAGQVLNAVTGVPIPRALVVLNGPQHSAVQGLTDAAGNFRFNALKEGRYSARAVKPQFQAQTRRPPSMQITVGPSQENVEIRLTPLGSIEGTVLDPDGLPLQGVDIVAISSRIEDGRKEQSKDRSVATDDRGHYRLWSLPPGELYLKAAGRSGGTRLYVGEQAPTFGARETITPQYYGGATSLTQASPLMLKPGDHLRADFTLTLQPALKIRGSLSNFKPFEPVTFQLMRTANEILANRVSLNSSQGNFEVQDVLPGTYRIRATQGAGPNRTRGTADITVSSTDLEGVQIELDPGIEIPIVDHCPALETPGTELADDHPPVADILETAPAPCFISVRLTAAAQDDEYSRETYELIPSADRPKLSPTLVLPGRYSVVVSSIGGYVAAARMGDVDLLSTPNVTVAPGSVSKIEVSVDRDSATIAGTLEGIAAPDAAIILAPSGGGAPLSAATFKGQFIFSNLAPGEYTLFALQSTTEIEYRNPELLKTLRAGASVRVAAKETAQVTIKEWAQ